MKIVLVSSGSGSRGGGEIYLRFLAEGLKTAGHTVTTIVPDTPAMNELAESLAPHCDVLRLPLVPTYTRRWRNFSALADSGNARVLGPALDRLAPDVVHVNQQVAEDALDLLLAASKSGFPCVSTIHVARSAQSLGARIGWARDILSVHTLRRASVPIITVSEASQRQLVERLGTGSRSRVHVVHNGVPGLPAAVAAEARARARADWGVAEDALVIGCVGRIEEQKNPLALARLAQYAAETGKDVRAVWIGDGSMRDALAAEASAQGVQLTIDGWRSDAAQRVAGFDIYALPSHFEGLPLALLEALHAGLPVVSSVTDGTPEAIRQGETGFLCEDEDAWRSAVTMLARDPDRRRSIGAAARADAEARFSIRAMAAATAGLYTAQLQHSERRRTTPAEA